MAGKKVGSDGQIRKTTAEWAVDTDTYPEGMRLMDTTDGTVRVSKGTTYALAWQNASSGAATWGSITGTLSSQTDLSTALNALAAPTATFSTNTNTAQDPGQDAFRFNNATIGSVTEISLSDVVGGVDKGDLNSRFGGIIQFRAVGTTTTAEFQITGVVHTSWTRYTVTYLKGTLPANGTACAVRFLPSVKPVKLNGTVIPNGVFEILEGFTDSGGFVVHDLSAYTTVLLISGVSQEGPIQAASLTDATPSSATVTYYGSPGVPFEGSVLSTFFCIP
jgi:hypothetical protein